MSLFLFLACAVALLVYALGFITGVYLFYAYGGKPLAAFYDEMQRLNAGLLWKAVSIIVCALVLFLLELGNHAAGRVTLIAALIIAATGLACSAESLALLVQARRQYAALDLSSLNRYIERGTIQYRYSTLTYDLGLAVYIILFGASLFMAAVVIRNAFTVREPLDDKEGSHETV